MRLNKHPLFDDEIIINGGDKDLIPIKLSVTDIYERTFTQYGFKAPELPEIEKIDFFNEDTEEQYFKRIWVIPKRLTNLERKIRAEVKNRLKAKSHSAREIEIINIFWNEIEVNWRNYPDEIEHIQRIWYYRLFGYWYMNEGRPTYMTGLNFVYLYYYRLRTGDLPNYRDRDRRWFLFQLFARLDTKTFVNRDKDGWAIPENDGTYIMTDLKLRVALGTIMSKPRRVGDTSKSGCDIIEEATRTIEGQFGTQALDDNSAARVFLHYVNTPFNKFPLILKPLQMTLNPKRVLSFDSDDPDLGLGSWVDYATTKNRSAYDGSALAKYYADEAGKVEYENIGDRHGTVKLCMTERDIILGNTTYTTTVESMKGEAADNFMELSRNSRYYQRMDNGQTPTGMYVCFFPAYDGHPSFVDKYGMSVIEIPTPEQAKFINKRIGCREYLENNRKILTGKDLALEKRQNPNTYRECFSPDPMNELFPNVADIQERIIDLKFDINNYRVGDFVWEAERFGRVKWVDNRETGKFTISRDFKPHEMNQWTIRDGIKYPRNVGKFVSCADPFRLEKTDSSRMSKGGFATMWLRDFDVDPEGTNDKDLKSERFILDYLEKPETLDMFVEDCLMACLYTGSLMYAENDIDVINSKFIEWGFEGYLLYDVNTYTGESKNNAGFKSSQKTKQTMFNKYRDYVKRSVKRDCHYKILQQALDMRGLDDLKNRDLLTAAMGCFLGAESHYTQYLVDDMNTNIDTSGWVRQYEC